MKKRGSAASRRKVIAYYFVLAAVALFILSTASSILFPSSTSTLPALLALENSVRPLIDVNAKAPIVDTSLNQKNTFFDYTRMPKGNGTSKEDWFSSSFWQSVAVFRDTDMKEVSNFEGVFARSTIRSKGKKTRLAYDYLDFSVEHLSKWWKLSGPSTLPSISRRLTEYAHRACRFQTHTYSTYMNTTVAVIPFCVAKENTIETVQVWKTALMATVCSIAQHSPLRINVVGRFDFDGELFVHAMNELGATRLGNGDSNPFLYQLSSATTLQFIKSNAAPTNNQLSAGDVKRFQRGDLPVYNVPHAAWNGLHGALKDGTDKELWLGSDENHAKYKYVYFSESDQILNARINPQFLREMDARVVLVPHRLQPIPHRQDFAPFITDNNRHQFLPDSFDKVVRLDVRSSCCDTQTHIEAKPKNCNGFWWQCGFHPKKNDFSHLNAYEFMVLDEGTGFVSLAATEHSRRCKPVVGERNCRPENKP